jgi:mRNA interferase RelE/StbE
LASSGKVWTIEIKHPAEKQIRKLDRQAQELIIRFLRERVAPADYPRQWGKPLHGEKRGLWRYRVGDYRLICDIQDERITVLALVVGHRKDVYRRNLTGDVSAAKRWHCKI